MRKKRLIFILTIFLLMLTLLPFSSGDVLAASSMVIQPHQADVSSSVEYCFGTYSWGGFGANYKMAVEFHADFDLTDLTISDTDTASEVSFFVGTSQSTPCVGGTERIAEATATADNDRDFAEITGNTFEITLEDAVTDSIWVGIKFKDKTDGDSNAVVTPADVGNYMTIFRVFDDAGAVELFTADLLHIGGANQVEISASVDPSLSLTLSANTCALGTFSTSQINTCSYSAAIATNAPTGYTASIKDDGNFRDGSNDIDDVSGGAVADGTEAYGVSTTDTGATISQINDADTDPPDLINQDDCTIMNGDTIHANASAITTANQSFSLATAPASETVYLCHAASISTITPAGTYSHIATITVVGNF
ncbi:MAG: hypothetical protein A2Y82_04470 [Candidatus Buchananbacteria bacterium RBG_13_36_9]|uniref:Uncharacterized protein n=1 Tax=Candidatus Buchananbacteria bacterium RBG_13_36_9 TaxID=1797530 RepID=A0A1G1XQY0_9BACT|nr:MAG: hypothetical protein A2Y82_04470 [Candidatus Buchananbacteria bacterium RBG_13_36_9]